jgi:hypothetical protein
MEFDAMTTIDDERLAEAEKAATGGGRCTPSSWLRAALVRVLAADDAFWARQAQGNVSAKEAERFRRVCLEGDGDSDVANVSKALTDFLAARRLSRQPQAVTEAMLQAFEKAYRADPSGLHMTAAHVGLIAALQAAPASPQAVTVTDEMVEVGARAMAAKYRPKNAVGDDDWLAYAPGTRVALEAALASPPGQQQSGGGTGRIPCTTTAPNAGTTGAAPAPAPADIAELCDRAADNAATVDAWSADGAHCLSTISYAFRALAARERRLAPLQDEARKSIAEVLEWSTAMGQSRAERAAWRALSRLLEEMQ